jgi:hypothetical protein
MYVTATAQSEHALRSNKRRGRPPRTLATAPPVLRGPPPPPGSDPYPWPGILLRLRDPTEGFGVVSRPTWVEALSGRNSAPPTLYPDRRGAEDK